MNQNPPPLPQSAPANPVPPQTKKKNGCLKNGSLIVIAGLIGLTILGALIDSAEKKKAKAHFQANRESIIESAQAALEESDFQTLENLSQQYAEMKDSELQAIIDEGKEMQQVEIDHRMGKIHAFKIWGKEETDYGKRKRRTWRIVVEGVTTPEDLGATLVYAAKRFQKASKADTVTVVAEIAKETIVLGGSQPVAIAHYIPDEKGWSGVDESKIWDIRLTPEIPSASTIKAHAIYAKNRTNILQQYADDNQGQYRAVRNLIAEQMGISFDEAEKIFILLSPQKEYLYDGENLSFASSEDEKKIKAEIGG